jgi:LysM repeat protein
MSAENEKYRKDRNVKAKELDLELQKQNLENYKEELAQLNEQKKEIIDNYNELSKGIIDALKEKYAEERDLQLEALDAEVEALEEATDNILAEYERQHNAKVEQIRADMTEEEKAIQAEIDALKKGEEEKDRARKEEADRQKIHDLEMAVQQAETAEKRMEAERKLQDEISKQADAAEKQRTKDKIAELQEQQKSVKENADEKIKIEKEAYEQQKQQTKETQEEIKQYYKDATEAINNNYKEMTDKTSLEMEASKAIMSGSMQDIVDLMIRYNPDFATAGMSAGEAYYNGLAGTTPDIQSKIQELMSYLYQAQQIRADVENEAANAQATVDSMPQSSQGYGDSGPTQEQRQQSWNNPEHVVQEGETISSIAEAYGVSVKDMQVINGLSDLDYFKPGIRLLIPVYHEGGVSMK